MIDDDPVHVDDGRTQLLASEQSGDVLVAIFAPMGAAPADVRRTSTRASEIAQNELAFHDVREEDDEDTDDYQQEDDPDRRDEDGTKYGPQGVGETVLTDGGTDMTATVDLPTPSSVIDETLAPLDVDGKTAALARDLARTLSGTQYAVGKRPGVLAAACVYLADVVCCPPSEDPITQREVSRATDVSKVSIRNHYQRIAVVCHRADPDLGDDRFATWAEGVSLDQAEGPDLVTDGGTSTRDSGRRRPLADLDEWQDLVARLEQHDAVEYVTVVPAFGGEPVYLTVGMEHYDTTPLNRIMDEWGLHLGFAEVTDDGQLRVNLGVDHE